MSDERRAEEILRITLRHVDPHGVRFRHALKVREIVASHGGMASDRVRALLHEIPTLNPDANSILDSEFGPGFSESLSLPCPFLDDEEAFFLKFSRFEALPSNLKAISLSCARADAEDLLMNVTASDPGDIRQGCDRAFRIVSASRKHHGIQPLVRTTFDSIVLQAKNADARLLDQAGNMNGI